MELSFETRLFVEDLESWECGWSWSWSRTLSRTWGWHDQRRRRRSAHALGVEIVLTSYGFAYRSA